MKEEEGRMLYKQHESFHQLFVRTEFQKQLNSAIAAPKSQDLIALKLSRFFKNHLADFFRTADPQQTTIVALMLAQTFLRNLSCICQSSSG